MPVRPSQLEPDPGSATDRGPQIVAPEAISVCVARQPIFDREYRVQAWELLFRASHQSEHAVIVDDAVATCQVMTNAAFEIGLDRLVGDLPAHFNFPRPFLTGELPIPLPPQRVVIEVLESVAGDAQVLDGLRKLRSAGYRIALDDYTSRDGDPRLLEVADVVKVDLSLEPVADLGAFADSLKRRRLRLVAEKVETLEQFEFCRNAGFELFQGYFLQRPETFVSARPPASRLAILQLLVKLQNPDYSPEQVERLVAADVAMSYRILRCINSSYFGLQRQVGSVRQAVILLGQAQLCQLCAVFMLAGFDDRPQLLASTALVRARMCEVIGQSEGARDSGSLFLTGLLSVLDAMLAVPMPQAVQQLPLDSAIAAALTRHQGPLGEALVAVIAWERGDWDTVLASRYGHTALQQAYFEALDWAERTRSMVAT
jgi:EAL and modified HD-GYP domain-containing signal transduction protein